MTERKNTDSALRKSSFGYSEYLPCPWYRQHLTWSGPQSCRATWGGRHCIWLLLHLAIVFLQCCVNLVCKPWSSGSASASSSLSWHTPGQHCAMFNSSQQEIDLTRKPSSKTMMGYKSHLQSPKKTPSCIKFWCGSQGWMYCKGPASSSLSMASSSCFSWMQQDGQTLDFFSWN